MLDVCHLLTNSHKCRRKIDGSPACDGCIALGISCTQTAPNRKRGRPNRYASGDRVNGRLAAPPISTITPSISSTSSLDEHASPSAVHSTLSKGSEILLSLGPKTLLLQILDDWFKFMHPLIPLLHRRWFLSRIQSDEADRDPIFVALVLSVCAATNMTLRESASERYGKATALRCLHLIKHHNLLVIDECTLDWCIAQYNVAWTLLRDKYVCADFPLFHAIKESMAGVQWLMAHKLDELSLHDKEISKRLYCILMALDLGANTNVQSYLNLHSLDEPFAQLLPKSTMFLASRHMSTSFWHGVMPNRTEYIRPLMRHYVLGSIISSTL
ncbi:hypothetical protein BKA67DRAFT_142907 [Truncatella angustata]|uniref:Zn(2)-C6 fungal-type domain-containing protein n=1 Tax=Truncatella angustata TaxID=152316 RepID=A0A9P8RDZ8_9PEZI|nr:uncharacterized protein BKA67DRAFT_142907 [Truncatella angustata]KAH6638516.1 hypothetical protein BKA67DRAFT_142907 [Truncatella angustata]